MKRNEMVLALLMCCSALVGCGEPKRIAVAIRTPPARLECDVVASRPSLVREYVIDWSRVPSVAVARAEHGKYVATVRTREGVIAGYITLIEGKLFVCHNNMKWRRDMEAALPTTEP